jgi:hypothetical protein
VSRHHPGPALFVTPTAPGRSTTLAVWSPGGRLAGRGDDVGMIAAVANAVVIEHRSALVTGDDGRCVAITHTADGRTVEAIAHTAI